MPLVACRACAHKVDTSALACPGCGATDPGKNLSRQQRDLIKWLIQLVFWGFVLLFGAIYVHKTLIPLAQSYLGKQQTSESTNDA